MIAPTCSLRAQARLAGIIWLLVGIMLIARGIFWIVNADVGITTLILCTVVSLPVGILKSRLVLNRVADRILKRIRKRGEGKCLFGVFSIKNWLMILLMIAFGRILRSSNAPITIVSAIYIAIGAGLANSSKLFLTSTVQ